VHPGGGADGLQPPPPSSEAKLKKNTLVDIIISKALRYLRLSLNQQQKSADDRYTVFLLLFWFLSLDWLAAFHLDLLQAIL
jgi:hypothetical protein